MTGRYIKYFFGIFLLVLLFPCRVKATALDSAAEIKKLAYELKQLKNMGYDYIKNAEFPNGDKDQVKGELYIDNDGKNLLNICNAYTMLYSQKWFYKADHRNKLVTVVNLIKDYNKKLKQSTEKEIFQNAALDNFLDSVVIKTASINKYKDSGDILTIALKFPSTETVRHIELVFNKKTNMPVAYIIEIFQPLQKTTNGGVAGVSATIRCSNFRKITEKGIFNTGSYFTIKQGEIELLKYDTYKLSTKL